ncbi:reverse transcriptase domain-containing protein [Tanacetum coccineum]
MKDKLPSKEKDPGSFTIPCDIGQLHINNVLADLGDSISLMPYTMYEKLSLGEPKATRKSLELADRSIQYPRGIIENVLIKVDNFVLPIDFVILDMPEDSRVPIILGRPFLATARAMIDVFNKKITLRVGDDEVIFDMDQSIKRPPVEDDECYRGLEKLIDQSDLKSCETLECKAVNDSYSGEPIRRIETVNTLYPVVQKTTEPNKVKSEQLYSASANEINEKKPELKIFPQHLEYAYLHGDKSFPIIISSKLSEKEKMLLLMLARCEKTNLVLNWEKCHFMVKEGIVLGHKISRAGIEVDREKIDVIAKLPYPTNVKGVRSFLGHAGFYRRFIKDFSMISIPMTRLLMKDAKFDFFEDCKKAFNILKENLTTAPIIISPNWNVPFELMCDASDFAVGADEPYAFKLCPDNIMRRCVVGDEIREILAHCHSGPTRGHHSTSITGRKVYEAGFFWPSIFKDAKDYHTKTPGSTRKQLRDGTTLGFVGIRTSKWETRTSLKAKKSKKLVKYQSSGILCVIVVMMELRPAFTTYILAHKLNLENLSSKISREFLI